MGKITGFINKIRVMDKKLDELMFSQVFHDSIRGENWAERLALNPGRWAIGYNWLYVIYRYMSEYNPKNILEFGLGQSTVFINEFVLNTENEIKRHDVVEQDEDWAKMFGKQHSLSEILSIYHIPIEKSNDNVFYDRNALKKQNWGVVYDLISIDAPNGEVIVDGSYRDDLIHLMPDILSERFVIVMDDYNNPKKRITAKKIKDKLEESKIKYYSSVYSGVTDVCVIASAACRYTTTL